MQEAAKRLQANMLHTPEDTAAIRQRMPHFNLSDTNMSLRDPEAKALPHVEFSHFIDRIPRLPSTSYTHLYITPDLWRKYKLGAVIEDPGFFCF